MLVLLHKIMFLKAKNMAENKLIVDKITTLRLLHDLRANMQKYALGQATPQNIQALIEGYALFFFF